MVEFCVQAVIIAVAAYFCGCFNGAVIVSKYILKDDVRNHGSGNAGLTNFYRTFGGPLTVVVILCDVLKMIVAVLFGVLMANALPVAGQVLGEKMSAATGVRWIEWNSAISGKGAEGCLVSCYFDYVILAKYWAGLWCVVGHMYPCMFKFKGGKGVLSGGTLVWLIDWRIALVAWGGFLLLAVLTKWVSLGSCWAGFSYPFATWFVFHDPLLVILAVIPGWLLVWKHRGNLKRILNGTESKFSFHHKKNAG